MVTVMAEILISFKIEDLCGCVTLAGKSGGLAPSEDTSPSLVCGPSDWTLERRVFDDSPAASRGFSKGRFAGAIRFGPNLPPTGLRGSLAERRPLPEWPTIRSKREPAMGELTD